MSIRLIVLLAELSLEGVTPNNGLFGEAPPKGVPFFRLQEGFRYMKRWKFQVYERVGKPVVSVCN